MSLQVCGIEIERVAVVDDVPDLRDTLTTELSLLDISPIPYPGPFASQEALVETIRAENHAVVCDHQFSNNYAPETGAMAVSAWYRLGFPALLTTAYDEQRMVEIRPYLHEIPVILDSSDNDPDSVEKGFELFINEKQGNFQSNRKGWRTLLRVQNVEDGGRFVDIVVPGWNSLKMIQLPMDIFPADFQKHVLPDERFFALVNVGAEYQRELYFTNFEYVEKIAVPVA